VTAEHYGGSDQKLRHPFDSRPNRKNRSRCTDRKAVRFREIREQLEDEYGVQPTNPEVVVELSKQWDGPN
jgi:hypothetical protein